MKYKSLRAHMKNKNLSRPYTYQKRPLVIDGHCFREMYMKSHSQFILGGEYDRFASYLKQVLSCYIKSNITCYVIFNGAMQASLTKRKEIHQSLINKVNSIKLSKNDEYCEPVFVKDVYKDVLRELGIKCYVCMYDSKKVLFSLARKLNCPVLTNNIEYVLYGVSVIPLKSMVFNKEDNFFTCSIFHETLCRRWNSFSDDIMSVVMTISDEDSVFYNELINIFRCKPHNYIATILQWIRRQSYKGILSFMKSYLKEESHKVFKETLTELRDLFVASPKLHAVKFLTSPQTAKQTDGDWFEHAVGIGTVAIQFINLKNVGILSGSWVVSDNNREDAMLPAVDIALQALGILTNSVEVKITFVGRKHSESHTWVIKKKIKIQRDEKESKINSRHCLESADHFENFIIEELPGFDLNMLEGVPVDCWILLISMLYYSLKVKRQFILEAYCIILSYVLLGPVADKVGVIKRCNFFLTHGISIGDNNEEKDDENMNKMNNSLTTGQCAQAANAVIDLFYIPEHALEEIFDCTTVHTFTEFQHCLQFINYLNRLCGEKIVCTAYHKTINCTFIYNLYILLKDQISPDEYIQNLLHCPSVYLFFKNILDTYFECYSSLKTDKQ